MTTHTRKQAAVFSPFSRILAVVVMTSMLWSQTAAVAQTPATVQAPVAPAATPAAPSAAAPVPDTSTAQAPPEKHTAPATLTLPAGTAVPLTMVTEIRKSTMKTGGPVRAEVMFPVTVGNRIAIPVGTFVDGTIDPVPSNTNPQSVFALIHFTQLTFANGYTAPLTANAESAMLVMPRDGESARANDSAYAGGARLMEATYSPDENARLVLAQNNCQYPNQCPPALPSVGPNPAPIVAGVLGAFFAMLAGLFIWMHHVNAKNSDLLMTNGTQLQMTLQQPLTLDTAQVSAAAATGTT